MSQQQNVKRTILVPQYMRSFSCIGSACEDTCCSGWRVEIDKRTYKKYKKSQNRELAPLLDKNIKRNRSNSTSHSFAHIDMEKNGSCPFLSTEKLCNIQSKLGVDYLSHTCSTYPRIQNQVNGIVERSAEMSCPEAARLALLNPAPMEFDEIEDKLDNHNLILKNLNAKSANNAEKYFWELRIFSIDILQNRAYSLWERLILLGMFYEQISECIENDLLDEIPLYIQSYKKNFDEVSVLRDSLAEIPVRYDVQMQLAMKLVDGRYSAGINNQRYADCLRETLQGIQANEGEAPERVVDQYQVASNEYYRPFMSKHEYILENYLVNYVYKNMFPFGGYPSVFDDYIMLVVHFSMIKLHLVGMAGFYKGLTTDLVIKLIQSFAKTFEHNNNFLHKMFHLLKENGYTTMGYMSILIKN